MAQTYYTTSPKGKHLSYEERVKIEAYKIQVPPPSNRAIARLLGRSPQTIHTKVKRGTVTQKRKQSVNGKTYLYFRDVYSAAAGQAAYDHLHEGTGRQPKWVNSKNFIDWVDERLLSERWSPDAVVGYAERHKLFCEDLIPYTKTLYNWINAGLMRTKNSDLPEKVSRKPRKAFEPGPRRRKILGKLVEERPQKVEDREEWGHWEIDTVVGPHGEEEPALLTLVERHSRFEWLILIKNQTSQVVYQAITQLMNSLGEEAERLFKPLISDNGSEFSSLTKAVFSIAEVCLLTLIHPGSVA